MGSVGRIISAALGLAMDARSLDRVTLDAVAHEAGMTPQAVYRYFRDVDQIIEASLRCAIVCEHTPAIERLSRRVLSDDSELASAMAGIVMKACETFSDYPAHMQERLFNQYRQVGHDASLSISKLICSNVDHDDVRRPLDVVKASVALTTIIAVATSFFSRNITPPRGSRLEEMLANLFVNVLQSGGRSSDAFREMDMLW